MTGFEFTVLSLAAYRVWQLVAEDDLALRFRRRLGKRGAEFVTCPWCLGFWISTAWAIAFWADSRAVWAAVPFALNAVLVLAYSAIEALQAYEDSLPPSE